MDSKPSIQGYSRKFSRKKKKEGFFASLQSWANTIVTLGLLITGTGVICYIPFHNKFSKLMLIFGLGLFVFGFAVKIIDICAKIIGGRS